MLAEAINQTFKKAQERKRGIKNLDSLVQDEAIDARIRQIWDPLLQHIESSADQGISPVLLMQATDVSDWMSSVSVVNATSIFKLKIESQDLDLFRKRLALHLRRESFRVVIKRHNHILNIYLG